MLNRVKLEQKIQQSFNKRNEQIHHNIEEVNILIKQLQKDLEQETTQKILRIDRKLINWSEQNRELYASIEKFDNELVNISNSISYESNNLRKQFNDFTALISPTAFESLQRKISQLQIRLDRQTTEEIESVVKLQKQLDNLLNSRNILEKQLLELKANVESKNVREQLQLLEHKLKNLDLRFQQFELLPQQQQELIDSVENKCLTLINQTQEELEAKTINAENRQNYLQEQLEKLQLNLEADRDSSLNLRANLEIIRPQIEKLNLVFQQIELLPEQQEELRITLESNYLALLQNLRTELGTKIIEFEQHDKTRASKLEKQFAKELKKIEDEFILISINTRDEIQKQIAQKLERIETTIEPLIIIVKKQKDLENKLNTLILKLDKQQEKPPQIKETNIIPIALNLGIDFGSSFTKVCFRNIGTNTSEIVTFSNNYNNLQEAILSTKIGILDNGTLIAGLTPTEWEKRDREVIKEIEFIKMRLADLDAQNQENSWRLETLTELDTPETVENLCAYYLSCVIQKTKHWIENNKQELITNAQIDWSANIGVPVEYCDSPTSKRFEKVLSLAWLLSQQRSPEYTIQSLGDRVRELQPILDREPQECNAIPEISAEALSFVNSVGAPEGFYVFFDVGDGTLDGASFRYWRDDGEAKLDFYSAMVKPLGLTALSQMLGQELKLSAKEMKNLIVTDRVDLNQLSSNSSKKQIHVLVGSVIVNGIKLIKKKTPVFNKYLQKELNMFIGGGGGKLNFYTNSIMATYKVNQQEKFKIPPYYQKLIPIPKDLELNGLNETEFYRFAVAYGLSIPSWELPEVQLPSEMARFTTQPLLVYDSDRNNYDNSKDCC